MADFETPKTVSVVITPSAESRDSIAASDFVRQVDALRELLALAGAASASPPRITRLEMNSPALVVFETDAMPARFDQFFADLDAVATRGEAPPFLSRAAFDTLKDFSSAVGKSVGKAEIKIGGRSIVVDVAARKRIDAAFGADTSSEGTVDGMLEAINVHGKSNIFALYPVVGANRVACKFDDAMLAKVRPALGRYVEIRGELKYRWREKFPFEAVATHISVLPSWDEQPSFVDIVGMAPDATGGEPAEEFTRKARHGW